MSMWPLNLTVCIILPFASVYQLALLLIVHSLIHMIYQFQHTLWTNWTFISQFQILGGENLMDPFYVRLNLPDLANKCVHATFGTYLCYIYMLPETQISLSVMYFTWQSYVRYCLLVQ